VREIGTYAGADELMEEKQPGAGLVLVTWWACSFFPPHPLFADSAAS